MLRIIGRCQLSFNECLLKNINGFLESAKQFKHGQPPPVLEPDDEFELGNFTRDLKPYLTSKRRKSYADKYLEEQQQQHDENEIPVIICKNKKLNHYRNQTYNKFKPIPLASEHWRSHKFRGDYFTIRIHSRDYDVKSRKEPVRFEQSNLRAEFVGILKSHGIEFMSEIQQLALPAILSGRNNSFGAETGSGKTLAYLLPIFEQILQWKENVIQPSFNAPYVLILAPSRELADQIRDFCRWFSHLGIKTQRIVGGSVKKKISNPIFDEIDILVSTPGVIEKLTHAEIYSMQNVRHVVLDEADCLLDDSFNDMLLHFLRRIHFRNEPSPDLQEDGVQLTMMSATMPTSVKEILLNIIDVEKLDVICTDRVHHILPNITHKFVRTGRTSKPSYFLDIAKQNYNKKAPSIIFCNRIETCNWVSSFLEDNNIPNILLHGEISLRDRKGKFQHFQEGAVNTLVTTSFAARGLDTNRVEHVVNFEFPSFIVEYIHRCGRTGRLSSKKHGVVTNLIAGRNEVPLVQKIERAVRLNIELENVNPNIRRILTYKNASDVEKEFGLLS